MSDGVVITGTGLVAGTGNSSGEVWGALLEGRSGIRPIEGFDASGFKCRTASQARGLDPKQLGIPPRSARIMDTHSYMLMKATSEALDSAGLGGSGMDRNDYAFFAGMGMVDYRIEDLMPAVLRCADFSKGTMDFDRFYGGAYQEIFPLWSLAVLNNISFCQIAIMHGIRGDNTVFSPHAEAGAQALWEASLAVSEGRAPVALAGGVSEKLSPVRLGRDTMTGVLSTGGEDASVMPFCRGRSGTVAGEAGAVVVLERASDAVGRGVKPIAAIKGYGEAFGLEEGRRAPNAGAVAAAMSDALEMAGLLPAEVDLLIAHGDGTPYGDEEEAKAIADVFGPDTNGLAVYSSKPALGHTHAAAPVLDTVVAAFAVSEGVIPPCLNADELDEGIAFGMSRGASGEAVRNVLINCTSIEGQCASMLIGRPE